jgi:hypothetical protein
MSKKKQKLVVIGNGMAGARTVEEILARGGSEQFEIAMFGDEPVGNYNRILLSNVLNGSYGEDEIYLNPLSWYRENGIVQYLDISRKTFIYRMEKFGLRKKQMVRVNQKLVQRRRPDSRAPTIPRRQEWLLSMRIGRRNLRERQHLTAVLPHKVDRLASLLKRKHAGRTPIIVEIRRPLLFVHQLASVGTHVHVASLHDESLGRCELLAGEV